MVSKLVIAYLGNLGPIQKQEPGLQVFKVALLNKKLRALVLKTTKKPNLSAFSKDFEMNQFLSMLCNQPFFVNPKLQKQIN